MTGRELKYLRQLRRCGKAWCVTLYDTKHCLNRRMKGTLVMIGLTHESI